MTPIRLASRLFSAALLSTAAYVAAAGANTAVDPPYFCGPTATPADPVDRAICGDKTLHVLYAALEFELEDAMTQAMQADKPGLLERLKSEHAAWERQRGQACPEPAVAAACLRSEYESRRREVAALLRTEGLKTIGMQGEGASTAQDERSAELDAARQREATAAAVPAPAPAPALTAPPAAVAGQKPAALAGTGELDRGFDASALLPWLLLPLLGYFYWSGRKKKAAAAARAAAGSVPAVASKKKWGWGLTAAVLVLILLSKQDELARASKVVASSAAPSFPVGSWNCGALGQVNFNPSGQFVADHEAQNPRSSVPLQRIGFQLTGAYAMESGDQLRLNVTRSLATRGSAEDLALLGEARDIRKESIRKYAVEHNGSDVVLEEVFRSFDGKVKEPSRQRVVCRSSGATTARVEREPAAPARVEQAPTPSAPPEVMTTAQAEDAVMQQMLRALAASPDGICQAMGQQMNMTWGYFMSSGQARFKDGTLEVIDQASRRGCL